jgi:DNA helicase-2/ATP-dependent DNA helicase PcrA
MIARLLEEGSQSTCSVDFVLDVVCEYILGHRGSTSAASQSDRDLVNALRTYCSQNKNQRSIRGKNRQLIVQECAAIAFDCNNLSFSGNVAEDWLAVRKKLQGRTSEPLKKILSDTYFIKLMHKGSALNSGLDQLWRRGNNYSGALEVVQNALLQEHFETSQRKMSGVNVMTIHKAKGKEFDEVLIWEGSFDGERFVYKDECDKARLNLRVAVTRAKSHTFIFTPSNDKCSLL